MFISMIASTTPRTSAASDVSGASSTTSPSPTPQILSQTHNGVNYGTVLGIAIPLTLLAIGIMIGLPFWIWRKRRHQQRLSPQKQDTWETVRSPEKLQCAGPHPVQYPIQDLAQWRGQREMKRLLSADEPLVQSPQNMEVGMGLGLQWREGVGQRMVGGEERPAELPATPVKRSLSWLGRGRGTFF